MKYAIMMSLLAFTMSCTQTFNPSVYAKTSMASATNNTLSVATKQNSTSDGPAQVIATNPRPDLKRRGKVVAAKPAAAPATVSAKIDNTKETKSGSLPPQATQVSSDMTSDCPAGSPLFIGGATLCPQ